MLHAFWTRRGRRRLGQGGAVLSRLRAHLENLLMGGALRQLLLLATVLLALAVVAAAIVYRFSPTSHPNFMAALWWSFLRLTDTGYLGEDRGWVDRSVSVVLTLTGNIVFLGALVAILAAGIQRALMILGSGSGGIHERGHVLVVGRAGEAASLLEELLSALALRGERPVVAVLLPEVTPELAASMLHSLPVFLRRRSRVLFRSGDFLDAATLERVAWKEASCLVMLASCEGKGALLKLLLGLSAEAAGLASPPRLVAQVESRHSARRLLRAGWPGELEVVPQRDFLGQLLAQAVVNPGLPELYRQLLTDQEGMSLHLLRPLPRELVGRTLKEAYQSSEHCIPLGRLRGGSVQLADLSVFLESDDALVMLAADPHWRAGQRALSSPFGLNLQPSLPSGRLLVCGHSPGWRSCLSDLRQLCPPAVEIVWLSPLTVPELPAGVQHWNLDVEATLEYADLAGFSQILLLAGELPENQSRADLEVIGWAHALAENLNRNGLRPRVVCELLWEDHAALLRSFAPHFQALPSARMLGHVLAQVAAKPALYEVYEDLLAAGSACFRSYPLGETLGEVTFNALRDWALSLGKVAVAVYLPEDLPGWPRGIHSEPNGERPLPFLEGRALLVLELDAQEKTPHAGGVGRTG